MTILSISTLISNKDLVAVSDMNYSEVCSHTDAIRTNKLGSTVRAFTSHVVTLQHVYDIGSNDMSGFSNTTGYYDYLVGVDTGKELSATYLFKDTATNRSGFFTTNDKGIVVAVVFERYSDSGEIMVSNVEHNYNKELKKFYSSCGTALSQEAVEGIYSRALL